MNCLAWLASPYLKALTRVSKFAERRTRYAHDRFMTLRTLDYSRAMYEKGRADAYDDMIEYIDKVRRGAIRN